MPQAHSTYLMQKVVELVSPSREIYVIVGCMGRLRRWRGSTQRGVVASTQHEVPHMLHAIDRADPLTAASTLQNTPITTPSLTTEELWVRCSEEEEAGEVVSCMTTCDHDQRLRPKDRGASWRAACLSTSPSML